MFGLNDETLKIFDWGNVMQFDFKTDVKQP